MLHIIFLLYQVVMLCPFLSGVVESKADLPGGSRPSAEAAVEERPARQGKSALGRAGPAATDPHPRQQKLDPPVSRTAKSHTSFLRLRAADVAAAQQAENGEHMEVCSPAQQPLAAEAAAPALGSGEPAAAPQICLSATSAEPLDAATPAAAEDAAPGRDSAAAAAEDAVPEQASPAVPASSEGAARRKQEGAQPEKLEKWRRPGAKTGLVYFAAGFRSFNYREGGPAMEYLRRLITTKGRKDLLGLLKGWLSYREQSSGNTFYKILDEGVIRSGINAFEYLEDLARLNAGDKPLRGVQHTCNQIMHRFNTQQGALQWPVHNTCVAPGVKFANTMAMTED